jgi:FixJ family two-component response regulator
MTSALRGRDSEVRAVLALLDRAQAGQSRALAAQGQSNREIAAKLFLSHRTVGYHLYQAYPKLGVSSRTELAALIAGQAR